MDAGLHVEADKITDRILELDFAKRAVEQEAAEYNNGWIPCSERLPEEKDNPFTGDYMKYPVMVNIDGYVDLRYYFYGDGHWRYGYEIKDKYVTHWLDIEPYQPKGEGEAMSNIFYGGVPIEQVDFQKEFDKELETLANHINELKVRKYTGKKINYRYWTLKLNRANKALEVGQVVLD